MSIIIIVPGSSGITGAQSQKRGAALLGRTHRSMVRHYWGAKGCNMSNFGFSDKETLHIDDVLSCTEGSLPKLSQKYSANWMSPKISYKNVLSRQMFAEFFIKMSCLSLCIRALPQTYLYVDLVALITLIILIKHSVTVTL